MEFKPQLVLPGFAESCSKMYILPTLTYLEVGVPAAASEISIFEPFNYEPISSDLRPLTLTQCLALCALSRAFNSLTVGMLVLLLCDGRISCPVGAAEID